MKAQFLDRSIGIDSSVVVREHAGSSLKKLWHYHPEIELMAVLESTGFILVGDSIERFEPGTIVLIGKNLPHMWQNDKIYYSESSELSALTQSIHFNEHFAGGLLEIPEMSDLYRLLQKARRGIKFTGVQNNLIISKINNIFNLYGYERILSFLDILKQLSLQSEFRTLSSLGYIDSFNEIRDTKILPVYEYIMNNFKEEITLAKVADVANMNPSAFSRYFKSVQKKTFIQFLNEIRIGYTCKLLIDGHYSITRACFESGFNNLSNFNRQFLAIKNMSPTAYLKMYANR